jgi:Leucine-rich repeat (LRR) protein
LLTSSYNLETLDLSHNKLASYSLKSANDFRRLQILNLAYNGLTKIEAGWQTGYLNLRDLNISHNKIGPLVDNR